MRHYYGVTIYLPWSLINITQELPALVRRHAAIIGKMANPVALKENFGRLKRMNKCKVAKRMNSFKDVMFFAGSAFLAGFYSFILYQLFFGG